MSCLVASGLEKARSYRTRTLSQFGAGLEGLGVDADQCGLMTDLGLPQQWSAVAGAAGQEQSQNVLCMYAPGQLCTVQYRVYRVPKDSVSVMADVECWDSK